MALFFNQRKPRGFNYQPRFYDPDAEAREDRKKIVLGEKYRSPEERERDAARAAGKEVGEEKYTPGSYLREHIAARRGTHAADTMHKRRRKAQSIPVLVVVLGVILLIIWMMYFR